MVADEYGAAWRTVSVDDLEVKEAANTAMRLLQSFTSTIYPYKLLEILQPREEATLLVVCDIVLLHIMNRVVLVNYYTANSGISSTHTT